MNAAIRLINRAYALCTRLYPRGFCDEYGDEMRAVFADAVAEACRDSGTSLLGLCWRELRDLPGNLFSQHWLSLTTCSTSKALGWEANRSGAMSETVQRGPWRIDELRPAVAAALPPLFYGVSLALSALLYDGTRALEPSAQLAVSVVVMLSPLVVLVIGSLFAVARHLPDWSYTWISAALMGLALVLMALGEDRAFLLSPALDVVVAVLFILVALVALGVAALRGWSQAGLVSIGFAATIGLSLCSAVGRAPFHHQNLALLVAPLGMALAALIYLYVRSTGTRRLLLLLAVGLLNLGILWMAGRVWRAWRPSQIQDMLPHLVIQAGALLSGLLLALFVQLFRRPQTLRH